MNRDFEQLLALIERKIGRGVDMQKLWKQVKTGSRPSESALNTLALLAGFQSWKDLRKALYGESEPPFNYEE